VKANRQWVENPPAAGKNCGDEGDELVRQVPVADVQQFYPPGNAIIETAIKQVIESRPNGQSSIGRNRSSGFGIWQEEN